MINQDKDKEINLLKSQNEKMKKEQINLKNHQNIIQEINKKKIELKKSEDSLKELNEKKNILEKKYKELQNNFSSLEKKKVNVEKELKECEDVLSSTKKIINNTDNLNKQINDLKKELKQKNEEIANIKKINNKNLDELKRENKSILELNKEKEKEIAKMKLELINMKKDKILANSLENKQKDVENKINYLKKKESELEYLDENVKGLQNTKNELEKNISDLERQKNYLVMEIKKYEEQMKINNNNNNIRKISKSLDTKKKNQNNINQINIRDGNNMNVNMNMNMLGNLNPASFPLMNNFIPNPNANINSIQFNNSFINQNQQLNNNPAPIPNLPPSEPSKPLGPIQLNYSKPCLIGLNNIGSTCYKNAVLQCLSQTAGLTNYFLKDKNKERIFKNNIALENPQELQLSVMYYELIQKLWDKKATYKSYSPNNFMNSLAIMTKNDQVQFSLYEAGDAKDFIIYILERMHKELRKAIGKKTNFGSSTPQDELNQYDKNNALNHFMDEFQNETSIISDLFYGFNETTNVCQFCKMNYNSQGKPEPICYNYGIFNILIFPLDEVRKYREQMMKSNNSMLNLGNLVNVVNIIECFYYNQKSDYFQGDNKNYCNICRQLWDSVYTSKIFVSPNILIIILNRGKGNQFDIKLDFTMQIDISDFVLVKNSREIYNLYGVITHLGKSGPNAHFVAACKSPVDGNWYRYNDAIVTSINNFQNDILNFGTPYILFYEKQK